MEVYNQDKTQILTDYDLSKGKLVDDILITHIDAIEGREEEGHYETIAEYPNGGKDVKWIVDVEKIENVPEHNEEKKVQIYIPFTEEELKQKEREKQKQDTLKQIELYKKLLSSSDYKAIKYAEGYYTDEEYSEIRELRESYRQKIRELEVLI